MRKFLLLRLGMQMTLPAPVDRGKYHNMPELMGACCGPGSDKAACPRQTPSVTPRADNLYLLQMPIVLIQLCLWPERWVELSAAR
mmetsp:Transcript_11717/g.25264  ORF Transcript_11717/g.25264 Transcript_11717/m.25264 type:complete len:85 (-) Transcript_11717:1138-1392(-)